MPPRVRRTSRQSHSASRRKLVWANTDQTLAVAANGDVTNIDLLADYKTRAGASTAGITIIRTHFRFWVNSAVTAGDQFIWGLKIDDIDQVVASSAAATVISPANNPYLDWMLLMHEQARPTYGQRSSQNSNEYDLRAKRRMEQVQEAYLLSVEPVAVTTVPLNLNVFARTLIALA